MSVSTDDVKISWLKDRRATVAHRFWNMVCDFILSLPSVFIIISNMGTDDICIRGSHGQCRGTGQDSVHVRQLLLG